MDGDDFPIIDDAEGEGPQQERDEAGNLLAISFADGSITINLDGSPLERAVDASPPGWFDNLADRLEEHGQLGSIAEDLIRGIDDDLRSRNEWIENRAQGIRLLGLKVELGKSGTTTEDAPVEGMSKVRHPLLLEAVLRFQANARSEMLPTDGPVKIRNDDNNAVYNEDQMANALERDFNHYLTSTATEYYPDTDRMYLLLGFGGTAFKKVYFCPLRNRPVSESVDAADLIVNSDATDLANAKRKTHRIMMRPATVKRMQILGAYRDCDLGTPLERQHDAAQQEKKDQEGVAPSSLNPEDRDREIYECYCELDLKGFEHRYKGKVSGLEVPYRVTIDVSSRKILSIVRNYNEATADLPVERKTFVKYTYVPGFGFYDIGLLHILGNTTSALTAAWREMLDCGMFANFPGFLVADSGGRQNTNIFRVPPGGGAMVKTNGMPLSQAVMPLPYSTTGMPALQALATDMAQTGMRVGGTSEAQVGEGRADAPVGTTLAMIEQATKIGDAVHKRMHVAQSEEFALLGECFRENPTSFWERNNQRAYPWDEATFLAALEKYDFVPQADPNTASHGQRVMKIVALKQLQAANPQLYDPIAIDTAALQTIGWSNPQQFFVPKDPNATPPPEIMQGIVKAQNETTEANAKQTIAQAKAEEVKAKIAGGAFNAKPEGGGGLDPAAGEAAMMTAKANVMKAETAAQALALKAHTAEDDNQNRDLDREADERIALLHLAKELIGATGDEGTALKMAGPSEKATGA